MTDLEVENKIKSQSYIEQEMVDAAFEFWYNDREQIRSPFPYYIRENLKLATVENFLDWASQISAKAKTEINDEILAEKLEEILFELGTSMVLTEDEKLTLKYPFLMRIGDIITAKDSPEGKKESEVTDRWILKRGDETFMKVKLKYVGTGEKWETEFELPE